jgi:hypothetical protein
MSKSSSGKDYYVDYYPLEKSYGAFVTGKRRDCALWNELFSIKRAIPEVRGAPCTNSKSHSMKKLVYAVCRSEPLRIFRSDDSCPQW